MTEPMHNHKSDADFVADVAKRLRKVPVSCGLDGFDIDCLADLSSRLRKAEEPQPATGQIVCDVWGGDLSQDHLARYMLPLERSLDWARQEIAAGFLVNMRHDADFGPAEQFDLRTEKSQ